MSSIIVVDCVRMCESQQDMRNSDILIVKYKRRLNVRHVLVSWAASHLSFTDFAVVFICSAFVLILVKVLEI